MNRDRCNRHTHTQSVMDMAKGPRARQHSPQRTKLPKWLLFHLHHYQTWVGKTLFCLLCSLFSLPHTHTHHYLSLVFVPHESRLHIFKGQGTETERDMERERGRKGKIGEGEKVLASGCEEESMRREGGVWMNEWMRIEEEEWMQRGVITRVKKRRGVWSQRQKRQKIGAG